ncbi:MAG TPA: HprK-related kinase A [Rhodocyclaceae bacterium]|nr:HprK-related kinase A [Rhodocyclaceae bacterium]
MIVSDLSPDALARKLAEGLNLQTGPLVTRIRSRETIVIDGIGRQYADYPVADDSDFVDFQVAITRPGSLRRWWHPQAFFLFEGESLFNPLPANQAFPLLEWGMNWCVSSYCHQYLMIHAAVVERNGDALILPAPPGSGKSTLCAALVQRGWRLLSDELTLIDPRSGMIVPIPRPVSLKNASIDVIRAFAPDAVMNPAVFETVKGTVAHMKAPTDSIRRAALPARPRWIVLPRYEAGHPTILEPISKARGLMQLAENAFNYSVHDRQGFTTLGALMDQADCYNFTYSRLDEAIGLFSRLADGHSEARP